MHYDLYRIPFNEGKGGKAERVVGASENGLSNNFPKVSAREVDCLRAKSERAAHAPGHPPLHRAV
jgi:hypothetical protein